MTRRSASPASAHRAAPGLAHPNRIEPEAQIHTLQRTAGNHATARWLQAQVIQPARSARASQPPHVTPGLESYLDASRGAGQLLAASMRNYFEPRFGFDFSAVRVHADERAADAADAINAQAFTVGPDIHFAQGRFEPGTSSGDRLIAHELTHVVQQGADRGPALQRQPENPIGPLPDLPEADADCSIDLAARRWRDFINCCAKTPLGRGCSKDVIDGVCKIIDCDGKTPKPITCPPGFKPGATRAHKGQCCDARQKSEDSRWCCAPDQIVVNAFFPRCCPEGTKPDAARKDCKRPEPPPRPPECPSEQKTSKGECCKPPAIPKGDACVTAPPLPPPPKPAPPAPVEVFFQKDKPAKAAATKPLGDSLTAEGRVRFTQLVELLRSDATLKVQLAGKASPEGSDEYNLSLAQQRAEKVAEALAEEGIDTSRIANHPDADLRSECQEIRPGVLTCGEKGATGPEDRQVLARPFFPNP